MTADKVNGSVPQIERCLSEIHAWMSANFLKLNSDKTEVLTFGTRQQLKKYTLNSINVAGIDVPIQSKPVRNLGVLFDCCMTMSAQVSSVIKTTSFHIRNISRIRKHLTLQAAKKLVNAVVTSRLDYSNALLAGITGGEMKRLQRIQNSAAHVIGGVAKFDHISDTRRQLHWLPINQRIDFKIALLTFKCIHGNAPEYLKELLRIQSNVRTNLRSNKSGLLLHVPKSNLSTGGDRSFHVNAPHVWNDLPKEIRALSDLPSFKKCLKTHYFKLAFNL